MQRPKALISWSSGKDSAFALYEVRRTGEFDVVGALTSVTETFERVSIHGVRQEILQAQCEAAGLPHRVVSIPYPCPNEIYEARMGEAVAAAVRGKSVSFARNCSSTKRAPAPWQAFASDIAFRVSFDPQPATTRARRAPRSAISEAAAVEVVRFVAEHRH